MERHQISSKITPTTGEDQHPIEEAIQRKLEITEITGTTATVTTATAVIEAPRGLVDFLTLLLGKLECKHLFHKDDISNLRLVSKEIKSCIETIMPIETLRMSQRQMAELPSLKRCLTEKVKSLTLTFTTMEYNKNEYARSLMNCHLPSLERFACYCPSVISETKLSCLPNWPALTCLELHNDCDSCLAYFSHVAKLHLTSLKELHYSSFSKVVYTSETVAAALSNLQGLTKLDLRTLLEGDVLKVFPKTFLESLVDLKLDIHVSSTSANSSNANDDFETGDDIKDHVIVTRESTEARLNPSSPCFKLKSFDFKCMEHSRQSTPFLVHIVSNARHLEELTLRLWKPSICGLQGLQLPCLKRLRLEPLLIVHCYKDLAAATLPALEFLEIGDWLSREAPSSFLLNFSSSPRNFSKSPFPSLRSVKVTDTNAAINFIKPLLGSLTELHLRDVSMGVLQKLFELKGTSSTSSGSCLPVCPYLSNLILETRHQGYDISVLKLLPAHCPSLEYLRLETRLLPEHAVEIEEIEKDLRDAAKEGVWYKLKLVEWFQRNGPYAQIWPY